jgi:hypothetical protein
MWLVIYARFGERNFPEEKRRREGRKGEER